mmetsp:Transcript_11262/g.21534  ORF Transcript_11262/g.21534 Transcript_11262/m.21534 type:complete len:350 (-) Transcript_11262:68-1117(-)
MLQPSLVDTAFRSETFSFAQYLRCCYHNCSNKLQYLAALAKTFRETQHRSRLYERPQASMRLRQQCLPLLFLWMCHYQIRTIHAFMTILRIDDRGRVSSGTAEPRTSTSSLSNLHLVSSTHHHHHHQEEEGQSASASRSTAAPDNALWESLRLRATLWAVEYFGLVRDEKDLPYQSLCLILNFMNKLRVYDLLFAPHWRSQLEDCAAQVVLAATSSTRRRVPTDDDLKGSTWRLAYTNDFSLMPPSRRMAYLSFSNHDGGTPRIHYSFHTDKSGWSDVEAECSYQLDDAGRLTYSFDEVTQNGGRLYGMQQGTSREIQTSYFDGLVWIDRQGKKLSIYAKELGSLQTRE